MARGLAADAVRGTLAGLTKILHEPHLFTRHFQRNGFAPAEALDAGKKAGLPADPVRGDTGQDYERIA